MTARAGTNRRGRGNPDASGRRDKGVFRSFWMAGFEGSSHRRRDGVQLDLIATTRHDEHAEADYRLVARCGLRTVRDALRWHAIERSPGHWDWSSFLPMLRAAAKAGTQVIWDLCHYGLPHDIDIWSSAFPDRFAAFAAAAARIVREETDAVPFWCPVNEISYWAWAGGEHALMYPHARERGAALKRQLVRAALAGIAALREVDGRTRFVTAEPLINVVPPPWSPEEAEAAEAHRLAQFEVCDMIAGHSAPELGGTADCLDIVGLNFYYDNQWFRSGPTIGLGHPAYRPLRSLLREVHLRYRRSLLIAETGAEGESGPGWLRYVGGEVRAGRRAGVPVEGVCIYPVMDYPGWENLRHCRCGLIRAEDEWRVRLLDPDLHHQLLEEQALSVPNTGSLTQPGAGAS
jgi:beta-glucosidase/6-phospho-beta-glucosidase/beta-galactosidase